MLAAVFSFYIYFFIYDKGPSINDTSSERKRADLLLRPIYYSNKKEENKNRMEGNVV